jgi:hypothetical protein
MAALAAAAALVPCANAAVFGTHNVYTAGGSVRPSGVVEGDFVAAGGKVVVDQLVKGDASVAGGSVDVLAAVGDDLRATGGDVSVESSVGGELLASGGNVHLTSAAQVARGASLLAGTVTVDGKIQGPLRVRAQKIIFNGEVMGDARLDAPHIELGASALVNGSLQYPTQAEFKRADGARIGGAISQFESRWFHMQGGAGADDSDDDGWCEGACPLQSVSPWVGSVLAYLALLACGVLLLLVFPDFSRRVADVIKARPGATALVGLASLLGVPALAGLLFITLLGIPLGVAVLALYPALLLLGYLVGVFFISRRIQVTTGGATPQPPESVWKTMGFLTLALLLVTVLGFVPFVGPIVLMTITLMGVGACILAVSERSPSIKS